MSPADSLLVPGPARSIRRALIVDDDPSARLMLKSLLSRMAYEVTVAVDGRQAVAMFRDAPADVVFMDIHMPEMNGLDAAQQIKQLSQSDFVPVIFVSGASETDELVRGIEAGGDDFVTKPFDEMVLRAKVRALERIGSVRRDWARLHARTRDDWEIAQSLLAEVVMGANPRTPAMRVELTPTDTFSADLFLAEFSPSGSLNLLLGDFTGHGLAAALAALPTAETFRSMTAKGFAPQQILIEINRKLQAQLPTGKFLAASFIQVSHSLQRIWVANCGMPDVLLVSDGGIRERIRSCALPLGVHCAYDLGDCLRPIVVRTGDRLVLASDGVHEAVNGRGEQFGRSRLEAAVLSVRPGGSLGLGIKSALDEFRGAQPIADDASLVEVLLVPELFEGPAGPACGSTETAAPVDSSAQWHVAVELHADALRVSDPVPMMLSQLQDIPGLDEHRSAMYTVLSELYSNALEHGVLQLSSKLKDEPNGFERYSAARERQLACLRDGWVRIRAVCAQWPGGGQLLVHVHDSGAGFDWRSHPALPPEGPYGRGLYVVRGLCRTFSIEGCGNDVRATYGWGAARSSGG